MLNNKGLNTKRLCKKFNDVRHDSYKMIKTLETLYQLKLFTLARIHDIFNLNRLIKHFNSKLSSLSD